MDDDDNNNALVFTSKRKKNALDFKLLWTWVDRKYWPILLCYSEKVFDFMWFMSGCGLKCHAWDLNGVGGYASFQALINASKYQDWILCCFKPVCQAAWLWYHISLNAISWWDVTFLHGQRIALPTHQRPFGDVATIFRLHFLNICVAVKVDKNACNIV